MARSLRSPSMIRRTATQRGGEASPRGSSPNCRAKLPAEAPLPLHEALRSHLDTRRSAQNIPILPPKRAPRRPIKNSLINVTHKATLKGNLTIIKSYPQIADVRSPWRLPLACPSHRIHSPSHPWKLPQIGPSPCRTSLRFLQKLPEVLGEAHRIGRKAAPALDFARLN
jgi:hypothetical protein